MRKVLGEVFFYLAMLVFTGIYWSVYFYNGHFSFVNVPLIIFVLLIPLFYFAYIIFSNNKISITKEDYKNKKLYVFTRCVMYIALTSYVFLIEYNKIWTLVLWFVILTVLIIDKKQVQ